MKKKIPNVNVEIDLLRALVLIVDLKSFAAAAVVLNKSQSCISQKVSRLEALLGGELFYTYGRKKKLTDFGLKVYVYASKTVKLNDSFVSGLRNANNGKTNKEIRDCQEVS